MSRRVPAATLLAVSIIVFVPLAAIAKGSSPIDYFTIQGPGILWPVRFTADLGPHLPYDHETRVAPHLLDSRHFIVRGYLTDDTEDGRSPFFVWLASDGEADMYVAGEEASGFNYRWFAGRAEFIAPVQQAILIGYALTTLAFAVPVAIAAVLLMANKRATRRAKPIPGTDSPVRA
jgi:hypothetical protein